MQVRGNYLSLFPRANSVELALRELPGADQLQFSARNTLFHPSPFSLSRGRKSSNLEETCPTIDPPVLRSRGLLTHLRRSFGFAPFPGDILPRRWLRAN